MRRFYLWVLAATLVCGLPALTSCSDDDEISSESKGGSTVKDYQEKSVAVSREGKSKSPVTLRFYNDLPNVAYISVSNFYNLLLGKTLTVTKTGEADYLLTTAAGQQATFNTTAETMAFNDYLAFVSQGNTTGVTTVEEMPYVKIKPIEYQPSTASLTFDMKKYGIDLKGDNDQVYVPLSTLSDLFSDGDYDHVLYNGERIFITDFDKKLGELDASFAKKPYQATERAADLAAYSYGELCFVVDHYYGMPGRSPLEKGIQSNGLNATIPDKLRDLLKSTNMSKYVLGLEYLSTLLEDGGHTNLSPLSNANDKAILTEAEAGAFMEQWNNYMAQYPEYVAAAAKALIETEKEGTAISAALVARNQIFGITEATGPKAYGKVGNTVYCLFNQFGPVNTTAWQAYYNGTGSLPTYNSQFGGDITTITEALDYAASDPEVENFVVDLSLNPGGHAEVLVAITSLINGQSYFQGVNTLTKQNVKVNYLIDNNFDRVFDEKDLKPRYTKLNYAFLTSRYSFSCGNLLPALMKDLGYLIIGEKSGGGSCLVQQFATPEGFCYAMSSYRTRLTDKNGQNIDGGIEPQIPLQVSVGTTFTNDGDLVDYPDFSAFYNKEVGTKISNWYKSK